MKTRASTIRLAIAYQPVAVAVLLITNATIITLAAEKKDYNERLNQDVEKATKLFSNKLVIPKEVIDPTSLPESLLMIVNRGKPSEQWLFTTLRTNRAEIKPTLQNEIVYQSIIDRGFAISAGFLSFVSAEVNAEDKLEVIAEDVLRVTGDPYLSNLTLRRATEQIASEYAQVFTNAEFYYVEFVQLSTIKYKVYRKIDAGLKAGYSGFAFNGKVHQSDTGFSLRKYVSVNYFPITVKSGKVIPEPLKILDQPIVAKATNAKVLSMQNFQALQGLSSQSRQDINFQSFHGLDDLKMALEKQDQ